LIKKYWEQIYAYDNIISLTFVFKQGKVKVSLVLIKHHGMKDIQGHAGQFHASLLHTLRKSTRYPPDRRLGAPKSQPGHSSEQKNILSLPGTESLSSRPNTIPTKLPTSYKIRKVGYICTVKPIPSIPTCIVFTRT
jgi:hypothetical protein